MIEFVHKKGKKALVLFIHGFMGGKETWINKASQSFPEMLATNGAIADNFDFAYFIYFTELLKKTARKRQLKFIRAIFPNLVGPVKSNVSIDELGELLSSEIRYKLKEYSELIVIAHSMGGLVSKSYILNQLKENDECPVKLYISLAVPHTGSEASTLAKLFLDNIQISNLSPMSDVVKYLNHHWLRCSNLPEAAYFYGQYDEVVPKNSAIPNLSAGVACECDHTSICKPETNDSLVYKAIEKLLLDYIKNHKLKEDLVVKELNDPDNKFNSELFVLKLLIADIHNVTINQAKSLFYNAEFARKLYSNDPEFSRLQELYVKIKDIYDTQFTKMVAGNIKNSHGLIAEVYEKIESEDMDALASALPYLQAIHKKGLIHHLANILDKNIWWAVDHTTKTIEEYLNSKGQTCKVSTL